MDTDSSFCYLRDFFIPLSAGMHAGSRQEEVIDHRLTDREWAEEWKHLDHVRKVITFSIIIPYSLCFSNL